MCPKNRRVDSCFYPSRFHSMAAGPGPAVWRTEANIRYARLPQGDDATGLGQSQSRGNRDGPQNLTKSARRRLKNSDDGQFAAIEGSVHIMSLGAEADKRIEAAGGESTPDQNAGKAIG
jgi:hypothetical protein